MRGICTATYVGKINKSLPSVARSKFQIHWKTYRSCAAYLADDSDEEPAETEDTKSGDCFSIEDEVGHKGVHHLYQTR